MWEPGRAHYMDCGNLPGTAGIPVRRNSRNTPVSGNGRLELYYTIVKKYTANKNKQRRNTEVKKQKGRTFNCCQTEVVTNVYFLINRVK